MYLGLDPGLINLGYMIINNTCKKIECGTISVPKNLKFGERLYKIQDELLCILRKYPDIEGISAEAPSYGSTNRAYSLGAVHGIIHLAAFTNSLPLLKVAPSQVKKFIAGHGSASKEQVKKELKTRYKIFTEQDSLLDISDAGGLAVIGLYFFTSRKCDRRCEMEVMNKLKLTEHL